MSIMNSTSEPKKPRKMKKLNKFAAIIIMVVLAVAANTATAQSVDNLLGTTTADTVKKVSVIKYPTVVAESTAPKGSKTIEKTKPVIFDGTTFIPFGLECWTDGEKFGGQMRVSLYRKGWNFSAIGRYVKDRSGLGLGIEKDLAGKSESRLFLSAEVIFGAFQQRTGIRSDIDLNDSKNNGVYHEYVTLKLRPQLEGYLKLQIRLSNRTFFTVSGGGLWRICEGEKLGLKSEVNFDGATVERSSVKYKSKTYSPAFSAGIIVRFM